MVDTALLNRGLGDLQRSLERFETFNDGFIMPDTYLIVRLDAHRYGDWTSLAHGEYPCGPLTTKAFHETAVSLMASAFRTVLAYCHGDEICLFLDPSENNSPLRRSRLISLLSSAASIHFMEASGLAATFQAKVSELPSLARVVEYLYWQRRVCYRNALTIQLRKSLIRNGSTPESAEREIHGLPEEQRVALLASLGTPIESLPLTTLRGALFWWEVTGANSEERYRLSSSTSITADDAEYLRFIQGAVRGKNVASNVDVQSDKPKPASKPIPPKATEPVRRPNKRANVSVFKM